MEKRFEKLENQKGILDIEYFSNWYLNINLDTGEEAEAWKFDEKGQKN